jgi:hypothetical protein
MHHPASKCIVFPPGFDTFEYLRQLRSGKDLKDVSESLEREACLVRSDNQIPCALSDRVSEKESSRGTSRDVQHGPHCLGKANSIKQVGGEQSIPDAEPWMMVTSDRAIIEHLMTLYFAGSIRSLLAFQGRISLRISGQGDADTVRRSWLMQSLRSDPSSQASLRR